MALVKFKTTEEFKEEVRDIYGDQFELLTPYKGQRESIKVRHTICGSSYEIQPVYFLKKKDNCRICRKTNQIREAINKERNGEYSLIGPYVNYKTPIQVKHHKCGNTYEVTPTVFMQGSNCRHCTNLEKYKTTEEFIREVFKKVEDEYVVLGEYVGAKTPISMKHMECGNTFPIKPNDFLNHNYRCPHCRTKKKITEEEFLARLKEVGKDEYTLKGTYKNTSTPLILIHHICEKEWKVTPEAFLNRGNRCPWCQGIAKKTHEEFEEAVRKATKNTFSVEGKYININTPITLKHNICERTFEKRPHNFLTSPRCPHCEGFIVSGKTRTTEEFKQIVEDLTGKEYTVLSEYTHSFDRIKLRHNVCGKEYDVQPSTFIHNGTRCSHCSLENAKKKTRKTHEDFLAEVVRPTKEYEALDVYKGAHTKIRFRHNVCEKVFSKTPNEFRYGKRCPNCIVRRNKRAEKFIVRMNEKFGEPYELAGEYRNARTKLKIRHVKCGEVFEKTPDNMLASVGCPSCNKFKSRIMTTEEFQEKVTNDRGSQYTVLSEYEGSVIPVKLRHEECGNVLDITPTGFFQGRGCIYCPPEKR